MIGCFAATGAAAAGFAACTFAASCFRSTRASGVPPGGGVGFGPPPLSAAPLRSEPSKSRPRGITSGCIVLSFEDGAPNAREFFGHPHSKVRADVFDRAVRHAHINMPEVRTHAADFGHRLYSVAHTQLRSSPRRELVTVSSAARHDRRHSQKALASARLVRVHDAAFFHARSLRVCSQIEHVERAQRAHKHVQMLRVDGRKVELYQHYKNPSKNNSSGGGVSRPQDPTGAELRQRLVTMDRETPPKIT
jgi:hypothetical protein